MGPPCVIYVYVFVCVYGSIATKTKRMVVVMWKILPLTYVLYTKALCELFLLKGQLSLVSVWSNEESNIYRILCVGHRETSGE